MRALDKQELAVLADLDSDLLALLVSECPRCLSVIETALKEYVAKHEAVVWQ